MCSESEAYRLSVEHLHSTDFIEGVTRKNLPECIVQATQGILASTESLENHAIWLNKSAAQELASFYGEGTGEIIIPFSGGRDSTTIALLTLTNPQFHDRPVKLISALPGYSIAYDNPRKQAERIKSRLDKLGIDRQFRPETDHLYLDISKVTKETVLNQANQDFDRLGYPGFCSSCKIAMETALVYYASQIGASHVAMGYTEVQARQQWPEQSIIQQLTMQQFLAEEFPEVILGSPLYNVIKTPVDTTLLLGWLGLPPDDHKCEMKCGAAGTNPREINDAALLNHVQIKQRETSKLIDESMIQLGTNKGPKNDFHKEIVMMKNSPSYSFAVYKEEKI